MLAMAFYTGFTMYITAGQQGCGDDMAVGQVATMGRKARDKATEN